MLYSQAQTTIKAVSDSLEDFTIDLRRAFHQIPEPSWYEEKTVALLKNELHKICKESVYSVEVIESQGGVWVDLLFDKNLPWLLFRADLDGLPIEEKTNLPFSSIHNGYMHACGHDCHTAMLLASFKAIATNMIRPKSNIRFVWQRAEECGGNPSGGLKLVEEGVCDGIDSVYALHISSTDPVNVFLSRPNVMMANSSYIEFTIGCSGGHVMRPNLGTNAISILSDVLTHLKGFEKLYFGPNEPICFVPSIASAGSKSNIRPNCANFCFAIRNFLPKDELNEFVMEVKKKINTLTVLYPSASLTSFNFNPGYPALYNDEKNYSDVTRLLEKEHFKTKLSPLLYSGEDFSYYLEKKPGSFWSLGAATSDIHDHHTPYFNPSEKSFSKGVAFWLTLASKEH